jgi:hypothetical protein
MRLRNCGGFVGGKADEGAKRWSCPGWRIQPGRYNKRNLELNLPGRSARVQLHETNQDRGGRRGEPWTAWSTAREGH